MNNPFKIMGTGEPQCVSCARSLVHRDSLNQITLIKCQFFETPLSKSVFDCSRFRPKDEDEREYKIQNSAYEIYIDEERVVRFRGPNQRDFKTLKQIQDGSKKFKRKRTPEPIKLANPIN